MSGDSRSCKQPDRPVVDVEVELEPRAEQDVARVPVVGDARVAERADEDRVELVAQHAVAVRRQRLAGGEKVIGAPRQVDEIDRSRRRRGGRGLEHLDRLGGDVLADAVAGDDGYAHDAGRSGRARPDAKTRARITC